MSDIARDGGRAEAPARTFNPFSVLKRVLTRAFLSREGLAILSAEGRDARASASVGVRSYLLGVLAFAIALACRFALSDALPPAGFPFLTFFPAVVLATLFGGLGPGLMVTALSALSAKQFFMPHPGTFGFASAADAVALGFFMAVALVDCVVIHIMNRALVAIRRERSIAAQADHALAEGRERLKMALVAGELGTWGWERRGGHAIDWDDRCKALFGLPPDQEITPTAWRDAVLDEDLPALDAAVARALDPAVEEDSFVAEYRIRRPDGRVVWVAAAGRAYFAPDAASGGRSAIRFLGTIRDVTASKVAEEFRRAREERDRFLLDLEERLRAATTAREAVDAACSALGCALGALFVGVSEMQPDGEHSIVESAWPASATPGLVGRHRVASAGLSRQAALRRGATVVVEDIEAQSSEPEARAAYAVVGARSSIDVPLMRDGALHAILFVGDGAPRGWSDAEILLARETLSRAWQAAERARAERVLAESEDRLRLALSAGRMGIWDWDLATDRVTWDSREYELFGIEPGTPITVQLALTRVHPDDRPRLDEQIATAIGREGYVYHHEFRLVFPDGRMRWIGGYGHAVRNADGKPVRMVGMNFDVTAQRSAAAVLARDKAELERLIEERTAALKETETRLAQAARMEALGRLAGGVAHDFNNVLQAVHGGIALAAKRMGRDPEAAQRFLGLASDATQRGAAVTSRLLAFARRSELSAAPIVPADLLDGLVQILEHTLGPSVTVSVASGHDRVPAILADAAQLETVLINLANNARDALPECCGMIVLGAEAVEVEAATQGVPQGLAPGAYVRLWVLDDGEGMSPEVLARVTEPFFTTKPKGKGTGLGLAMARGFAEQSGGALSIESSAWKGTVVSLYLPRATDTVASHEATPDVGPRGRTKHRRLSVLLVDDEPQVRAVLAAGLADAGHAVAEAADGAGALSCLAFGFEPDVLVTDLAMPGGMDGLTLVGEVRRRCPGLPAVLVTGHAGEAAADALRTAGACGPFVVVRKPVSPEALCAQTVALAGAVAVPAAM
jgi:PAS domain S-box-containing protein